MNEKKWVGNCVNDHKKKKVTQPSTNGDHLHFCAWPCYLYCGRSKVKYLSELFFFSFLIHGRKGQRRCAPWELYQSPYALIWYLSRAHIDGREKTFSTTGLFSFAHDGEREESVGSRMGKKVHDMSLQKKKVSISLCCRRVGTKHGPLNLGPHLDPHLDPHLGPLLDPLSGSPSGPLFFPENTGSLF